MNELELLLKNYTLLLGSRSPRRRNLLNNAGIKFKILPVIDTDENFPEDMPHNEVPVFLSQTKAGSYKDYIKKNNILITADTIVSLENQILGKPNDVEDAKKLLNKLSGKCHQVISGVSLTTSNHQKSFNAITNVHFKNLSKDEINFYVTHYKPLDKAGAYGIQEWIGYIGVEAIEGSFYNVMGLPIQKLYIELIEFGKSI